MRYLFGFICVLALGVMGCGEAEGTGGSGGSAGTSGTGGDGGSGGNGVACVDNVCPCSEAGIRAALGAGGEDPYTFDCDGPQTVTTEATIVMDNIDPVILDGEGRLTLDGGGNHTVLEVHYAAEIHGFRITGGPFNPDSEGSSTAIDVHGALTLENTTVSKNQGIGIYSRNTLHLVESTVSDNWINVMNNGMMTVTNSTISNGLGEGAAGIHSCGGLRMLNSTVSGNAGRAITVCEGNAATLTNCTVLGTLRVVSDAIAVLKSTIIDGDCENDAEAIVISNGHNIESPGDTCGFDQDTDQVDVTGGELNLGPLANNGGPTITHALGASSVAIDVIPEAMCELPIDQRGQSRPETGGTMCDVGAFEAQSAPAEGCIQSGGTVSTGLCCQAVESFPNTCTIGACGCGPDASHEVDVCICPANACFDGESCAAQ
jgi:hypothetical protein